MEQQEGRIEGQQPPMSIPAPMTGYFGNYRPVQGPPAYMGGAVMYYAAQGQGQAYGGAMGAGYPQMAYPQQNQFQMGADGEEIATEDAMPGPKYNSQNRFPARDERLNVDAPIEMEVPKKARASRVRPLARTHLGSMSRRISSGTFAKKARGV